MVKWDTAQRAAVQVGGRWIPALHRKAIRPRARKSAPLCVCTCARACACAFARAWVRECVCLCGGADGGIEALQLHLQALEAKRALQTSTAASGVFGLKRLVECVEGTLPLWVRLISCFRGGGGPRKQDQASARRALSVQTRHTRVRVRARRETRVRVRAC
jgi:hypothetical protein